ncbi:MAG: ABC transporter ATP-binding protein [Desulfurococcaceae archaeon]
MVNVNAGYKVVTDPRSVFKKYKLVLKDINLELLQGERVAVIGESGSGKTTLLRVIIGLLKPIRGEVFLYDKPIYRLPRSRQVEILRRIGYVPQDPYKALNPLLRVRDIIAEPLEAVKVDRSIINTEVEDVVKLVGLPREILNETPDELSGGMRQRVLIARALINKPKILVLDEPTSALDVSLQAQIINLINELYYMFHPSMIVVTHDLAIAQYLADRAVILKDGVIIEGGSIDEILNNPTHEYTMKLVQSYLQLSI